MIIITWHELEIGKHYRMRLSRTPNNGPEETHVMGFIVEREATEQEWKDETLELFGDHAVAYNRECYFYKLLAD